MDKKLLILTKFDDEITNYLSKEFDAVITADYNKIIEEHAFFSLILFYSDNKKDSIKVIKKLKETTFYRYTPIVLLNRDLDNDFMHEALMCGVIDVISLPTSQEKISNRIKGIINRFTHPSNLNDTIYYDSNLKLYTRDFFIAECEKALGLDVEHKENYHIIRMSIINFLILSYTLGKKKIDKLIEGLSKELIDLSKGYDIRVCKVKSDEFYILFDGVKNDVISFITNLTKNIDENFPDVCPELSFGIVECNDYEQTIVEYMAEANQALDEINNDDEIKYNFYDEAIKEKISMQQEYLSHFESAIKNNEVLVYYQPKIDIINNVISGAEALVRWKYNGKILFPGVFIPIFESNGNIAILDYYVWEQVCIFLSKRIKANLEVFPISVNVSRLFLTMPDFVETLENLLKKYDLSPKYLELEITETIFTDVKVIKNAVSKLRELGFKILMDDFGSAYSSLNVLKEIDFDVLKIDMRFFSTNNSKKGLNIIKSVLDIANALDVPAIAEGVEEEEYVKLLRTYGCNFVQGYFFSKPLPEEEFNEFITKNTRNGDKGKFVNFYHLNEAVREFQINTKNYIEVTKKDISKLLKKFLKELDVDSIGVAVTSADNLFFEYTMEETVFAIKPVLGKQIRMDDGSNVDEIHHGEDEVFFTYKEGEIPQIKCKGALMFPISNVNTLIGGVVLFRFNEDKIFTDEEKRALTLLAANLNLPIYREHTSKVREVLDSRNQKLSYALEVVNEYRQNVSHLQALFINSLKMYPTVCIRYNYKEEIGWAYTTDDKGHLIVHDRPKMKQRILKFISLIVNEKDKQIISDAFNKKELSKIPHKIDVLFDIITKKQTLTPRRIELNIAGYMVTGDDVFMCTVIDRTSEYEEIKKQQEEVNNIRGLFLKFLMDDFVSLTTYALDTKEITTYYREGNDFKTNIVSNGDWIKHRNIRLAPINESEDKARFINDSSIENLRTMEIDKAINYKFSLGSGDKEIFIVARLLVTETDGKRISSFLVRDVTSEVKKEQLLNYNIDVLTDKVGKDPLTQLYNRNGLIDNINEIKEMLQDGSDDHFLVFLDADLFKQINDGFGHIEGDKALTAIAEELKQLARNANGFAYRFGGDEFILILNYPTLDGLVKALENVNETLKNKNDKYLIRISYGIEVFSSKTLASLNEDVVKEIIDKADKKLIEVKKENNSSRH